MRFPFFATNKRMDKRFKDYLASRDCAARSRIDLTTRLMGLEQKVLVLEGRVNKLEANKTRRKHVMPYTSREWLHMNKERRKRVFAGLCPAEQQHVKKIEEALKHGRKKGN